MRIEDMSLAERVAHYVKMRFKATRRRTGRYDGAELCAIRKLKGVGRPPAKDGMRSWARIAQDGHTNRMANKLPVWTGRWGYDQISDRRKFIFAPPGRDVQAKIIGTAWLRKGSRYG